MHAGHLHDTLDTHRLCTYLLLLSPFNVFFSILLGLTIRWLLFNRLDPWHLLPLGTSLSTLSQDCSSTASLGVPLGFALGTSRSITSPNPSQPSLSNDSEHCLYSSHPCDLSTGHSVRKRNSDHVPQPPTVTCLDPVDHLLCQDPRF